MPFVHLSWYARKKTGLHYYSACWISAAKFAQEFPAVRFDFAHCRPTDEMADVVAACPNVWTDTAFMDADGMRKLPRYDWHGRLMFGSDVPTWQARGEVSQWGALQLSANQERGGAGASLFRVFDRRRRVLH